MPKLWSESSQLFKVWALFHCFQRIQGLHTFILGNVNLNYKLNHFTLFSSCHSSFSPPSPHKPLIFLLLLLRSCVYLCLYFIRWLVLLPITPSPPRNILSSTLDTICLFLFLFFLYVLFVLSFANKNTKITKNSNNNKTTKQ